MSESLPAYEFEAYVPVLAGNLPIAPTPAAFDQTVSG
jgi:hypothetical protein